MNEQLPSDQFVIGEIAILVQPDTALSSKEGVERGSEVMVTSGLVYRRLMRSDGSEVGLTHVYMIAVQDGRTFGCPPSWLRKKKPPAREDHQLVSWDLCIWKPKQVAA